MLQIAIMLLNVRTIFVIEKQEMEMDLYLYLYNLKANRKIPLQDQIEPNIYYIFNPKYLSKLFYMNIKYRQVCYRL